MYTMPKEEKKYKEALAAYLRSSKGIKAISRMYNINPILLGKMIKRLPKRYY
jgi:hypothetical protein